MKRIGNPFPLLAFLARTRHRIPWWPVGHSNRKRTYRIGNTRHAIRVETLCQMSRPIRLWMKEDGGMY